MVESKKLHCKYSHPIDPSLGRCRSGHVPRMFGLWELEDRKVGFFDIETSGLKADFDTMYTWFIKPMNGRPVGDCITKRDVSDIDAPDKRILKTLVKEMLKYDVLVTYYGTNFDIKFVRTRCLELGIPFPLGGEILHWDLYYVAKHKLLLSRNRLDNVSRLVGVPGKDHVDPKLWRRARYGDQKALRYIYNHNRKDVEVLEGCYHKLEGVWKKSRRSI